MTRSDSLNISSNLVNRFWKRLRYIWRITLWAIQTSNYSVNRNNNIVHDFKFRLFYLVFETSVLKVSNHSRVALTGLRFSAAHLLNFLVKDVFWLCKTLALVQSQLLFLCFWTYEIDCVWWRNHDESSQPFMGTFN